MRFLFVLTLFTSLLTSPKIWASNPCDSTLLGNLPPPVANRLLGRQRASSARSFAPVVAERTPATPSLSELTNTNQFHQIARTVRGGAGEQEVVKIVFHRGAKGEPQFYFINTKAYAYHYSFVSSNLDYRGDVEGFNSNYTGTGEKREYNLASLVLSKGTGSEGSDQFLLEIWNGDSLAAPYIKELYDRVRQQLKIDLELIFHPLSVEQEKQVADTKGTVPFITTQQLYGGRTYFPLNEATAVGYLRFVDPSDEEPDLDLNTIAVFENVPNDIGLVGGVITEELQTPLSHVNVKSMNRGTMNFSLVSAKEKLKEFIGKPVEIIAGANGYTIRELPADIADREIASFWKTKKPRLAEKPQFIIDPKYDGTFFNLDGYYRQQPTREQHRHLIRRVGAKAANLALLNWVSREKVAQLGITSPRTVGALFNHYEAFMNRSQLGLDPVKPKRRTTPAKIIREILDKNQLLNPNVAHPIEKIRPALTQIREIILRAEVPAAMIALFHQYLIDDPDSPIHFSKEQALLLRSSTNSEDLEGFTGAGLYNSTKVELYERQLKGGVLILRPWSHIEIDLRKAIGYVYSAIWNLRAYQEREWFSMDGMQHLDVKAGIAIHGAFADTVTEGPVKEIANGVAITANIFDPSDTYKIYLNSQHYSLSVTNPPTLEELREFGESTDRSYTNEELFVMTILAQEQDNDAPDAWQSWAIEKLRTSSIRKGASVFSTELESRRLARALKTVADTMAAVYQQSPDEFVIDAEWNIFGAKRIISINQVRPFKPKRE